MCEIGDLGIRSITPENNCLKFLGYVKENAFWCLRLPFRHQNMAAGSKQGCLSKFQLTYLMGFRYPESVSSPTKRPPQIAVELHARFWGRSPLAMWVACVNALAPYFGPGNMEAPTT